MSGRAEDADVARGKYLVELGGCTHCHRPCFLAGKAVAAEAAAA